MTKIQPARARGTVANLSLLLGLLVVFGCGPAEEPTLDTSNPDTVSPETTIVLDEGWQLARSAEIAATPVEVSTAGFEASEWTPTDVPTTVMAALVRVGEIDEPYFARKLEEIPTEQFGKPWWYRTEFDLQDPTPGGAWLVFEGINYSADIWLNGQQIATREEILGAFRMFEMDVSSLLVSGTNALAVQVHPPQPGDPTIGFVDWNPKPPDRNMGLWREVNLRLNQGVGLTDVFVQTDLDLETLDSAALKIQATVRNETDQTTRAVFRGQIGNQLEFEHPFELGPREVRQIEVTEENYPQLRIDRPLLWWPNGMGLPHLYNLELSVLVGGSVSDHQRLTIGFRHVEDYLTEDGYRSYKVNGKRLMIRGGGWVDELMLADDNQRIEDQMRYVRHMNLNTVRLEGFWGSSHHLFDMADRYGILVMVGWSCQWEWEDYLEGPVDEFGGIDTPEEIALVSRSLRDQVLWLRNHPSVFVWVLGSDMLPRPELEERYLAELAKVDTTRPALAACATATSEVSGPTGVKMNGPYDWVPPLYWYVDQEHGGAYGFNTETGPGPQPPPIESLQRMLPEENWWPIDEMWNYHSGRNQFNTIDNYRAALDARYGEATDLEDFARKAQIANYEGMRAMFEAFSIRRPKTTGIIQWMLNSAWPELYWQLYDYYLVPNGAFYGARDAFRPINIAFDRADRSLVVVNETATSLPGATVRVRVLGLDSEILFDESQTLDIAPGSIRNVHQLAPVSNGDQAFFLDARILAPDGTPVVSSFYWLPAKEDVLDWEASEWYFTPTAEYADLTALADLPAVELAVEHRFEPSRSGQTAIVTLENPTDKLAFFVELAIVGAESGRLATPIFWSENYLSLLPGERREVRAEIPTHALNGESLVFRYSGVNVSSD